MHLELYIRLGFEDNTATSKDIKAAYRRLVMQCHPDRFQGDTEKEAMFLKIKEAYEILMDEDKRADYDKTGNIAPDGEEKVMRHAAVNNIINTYTRLLDQTPEELLDTVDVKGLLIINIDANRKELQKEIDKRESIIRKLERSLKKFKKKEDKEDVITLGSAKFIAAKKIELAEFGKMSKILDMMDDMLANYDYEFISEMQRQANNMTRNYPLGGFVIRVGA